MHFAHPRFLALTIVLLVTACAGDSETSTLVVRDSAGIEIVENGLVPHDPSELRLSAEPSLVIGGDPEDTIAIFGRVMKAGWLRDGRVAVADALGEGIMVFDAEGRFERRIGRSGDGPGEFRPGSSFASIAGDSILVHEFGEVEVFTAEGQPVRTVRTALDERGVAISVLGWYSDGRYLASGYPSPKREAHGLHVDSATLMEGSVREQELVTVYRRPIVMRNDGEDAGAAFSPESGLAVDDAGFWSSFPTEYEIKRFDRQGRLIRIVRREWEPLPVTEQHRARYVQLALESYAQQVGEPSPALRERLRQQYDARGYAPTFPPFSRLVSDGEGGVWVQLAAPSAESQFAYWARDEKPDTEWDMFDREGRWRGTITLPAGFELMEIRPGEVLGVHRDELDVPTVKVYRLQVDLRR